MNDYEGDSTIFIAAFVAYVAYLNILILIDYNKNQILEAKAEANFQRKRARDRLMNDIKNHKDSRDIIRMRPHAFQRLCFILRGTGRLRDNQYSCVEEQVAKFLHVLSQNVRNRTIRFFFRRSLGTISSHFHNVLRALISLEDRFLVQPTDDFPIPNEILMKEGKFYPYFEKCIGAIDGTHIRAKIFGDDKKKYRSRKQFPTQNILVACTFDLKFTYVLAGWEGSAHDSRILEDALTRVDRLKIPRGRYYLADAGYMLTPSFLTPYRGMRYHLKEYSNHAPENSMELFNLRHSSLRNAVERCIGVLKKRFPIIASGTEPQYNEDTISDVFIACCIIHNFLMGVDSDEELIAEVDNELMHSEEEIDTPPTTRNADYRRGEMMRDNIALMMWRDYNSNSH